MTVGIDLTVLQTPHRMRGIGYTVIQFINNLSQKDKQDHNFVFYLYEGDVSPLELLNLQNLNYEIRLATLPKRINLSLPGKLKIINGFLNQLNEQRDLYFGDSRLKSTNDLDTFIQFDQNRALPSRVRSSLVLYDLIPYILESDYLWGYRVARANGKTRKGAIRTSYHRYNYRRRTKLITRRASKLLAISEHTKNDFVKYIGIKPNRIAVCLLGVEPLSDSVATDDKQIEYYQTSWGNLRREINLTSTKYLLFVGGADPRRKLIDLVAAFNNLVARGEDIHLVLVGDTMHGPLSIPNIALQKYFKNTSYLDRIHFMGFASNGQKEWLYKNAFAFVYPSVYEGYGLPVLEAMRYNIPVITYPNSSIMEVGQDAAIYTYGFEGILEVVNKLLNDKKYYENYANRGPKQANKFLWSTTSKKFMEQIT